MSMEKYEQIIEELQALRLANLNKLIGDEKLATFAKAHDIDASYISQLRNEHRPFGEKAARKIEWHLKLNWFDLDNDTSAIIKGATEEELMKAITDIMNELSEDGVKQLVRAASLRL